MNWRTRRRKDTQAQEAMRIKRILILFLWDVPVMMFRIWQDTLKWDREMRKFMRDIKRGKDELED